MKRILVILLMIWACFILQTSIVGRMEFLAVKPNLILILTVSIGFMQGRSEGLLTGFVCGLLVDLFYGSIFGFYALLYMAAGYFSGRFSQIYFDEDVKIPLVLVAFTDLIINVCIYVARFLLRGRLDFFKYAGSVILPEVPYLLQDQPYAGGEGEERETVPLDQGLGTADQYLEHFCAFRQYLSWPEIASEKNCLAAHAQVIHQRFPGTAAVRNQSSKVNSLQA